MSQETQPGDLGPDHKLRQLGENWRRTQSGDMVIYEGPIDQEYFVSIADRHRSYNEKSILWRILRKVGIVPTTFD